MKAGKPPKPGDKQDSNPRTANADEEDDEDDLVPRLLRVRAK
jgi:hypothetical protein